MRDERGLPGRERVFIFRPSDFILFGLYRPTRFKGAVAQLGEHLLCKQGVVGSIPISSTSSVSPVVPETMPQYRSRTPRADLRCRRLFQQRGRQAALIFAIAFGSLTIEYGL
jgi:hypothetical protein